MTYGTGNYWDSPGQAKPLCNLSPIAGSLSLLTSLRYWSEQIGKGPFHIFIWHVISIDPYCLYIDSHFTFSNLQNFSFTFNIFRFKSNNDPSNLNGNYVRFRIIGLNVFLRPKSRSLIGHQRQCEVFRSWHLTWPGGMFPDLINWCIMSTCAERWKRL